MADSPFLQLMTALFLEHDYNIARGESAFSSYLGVRSCFEKNGGDDGIWEGTRGRNITQPEIGRLAGGIDYR